MGINLRDFFNYYDDSIREHREAISLLANALPDDLLLDDAAWVKKYRSHRKPMATSVKPVATKPPCWLQTDNYTMQDRSCNSSATAMGVVANGGKLSGDDEFLRAVLRVGDTTDNQVVTRVARQFGVPCRFLSNASWADVDKELDENRVFCMGILHRGTDQNPTGGHWICVWDYEGDDLICHDPYGTYLDGYKSPAKNGCNVRYSRDSLQKRFLPYGANSGFLRVFA